MKLNITLGLGNKINIALFWFKCPNNKINTDTDNIYTISDQVSHKLYY